MVSGLGLTMIMFRVLGPGDDDDDDDDDAAAAAAACTIVADLSSSSHCVAEERST